MCCRPAHHTSHVPLITMHYRTPASHSATHNTYWKTIARVALLLSIIQYFQPNIYNARTIFSNNCCCGNHIFGSRPSRMTHQRGQSGTDPPLSSPTSGNPSEASQSRDAPLPLTHTWLTETGCRQRSSLYALLPPMLRALPPCSVQYQGTGDRQASLLKYRKRSLWRHYFNTKRHIFYLGPPT